LRKSVPRAEPFSCETTIETSARKSTSAGTADAAATATHASLEYDPNIETYLEVGKKRTFAGAVDWPGFSRSGKTADEALQALFDYAPRYARVVHGTALKFSPPKDPGQLKIVEKLQGDTTTDFGSPGMPPNADDRDVSDADLERLQSVLRACWKAFDAAVRKARGKDLQPSGPRGGGRDLDKIVGHVLEAECGYVRMLGLKVPDDKRSDPSVVRKTILDGVAAAARGETETEGPRGGRRWNARYFTRRVAWHALDHAWEIEDRTS